MTIFYLPDLGEGIPEADIIQWYVKEGDNIKEDQVMVSVETAKAVVEVPSPVTGMIIRLCGKPGDTIMTGAPLVEFDSGNEDTGTVVGKLVQEHQNPEEDDSFIIGAAPEAATDHIAPSPQGIAALADKYRVNLASLPRGKSHTTVTTYSLENPEPLKGVRKHMARTMAESHASVVPVTLFDDADIHHWPEKEDITVRLIQAMVAACKEEPALNAWFDGASMCREVHQNVNLGLAIDSKDGLFVPVIREAEHQNADHLRQQINRLREGVNNRSIPPSDLQGASITLSNFGVFAGSYGTPIVVPPMVCIIGVGKLRHQIISANGKAASHRLLPLSLTFDHRAATGGEATRFLQVMIQSLLK